MSIAWLLRVEHLSFGLPQRLHPDEWSQVEVAWRMAGGDWNPHFFRYPAGHMTLLALLDRAWMLFMLPGLPALYLAARWVSALFGMLCVGLAGLWAYRLWRAHVPALLAASLVALNWTMIEQSHYAVVDVPLAFWCGLALFAIFESLRKPTWLWLSAVAMGFSIASKYTAALLFLPFLLVNWLEFPPAPSVQRFRFNFLLGLADVLGLGLAFFMLVGRTSILAWAASLTTDGYLEAEYLALYTRLNLLAVLGGAFAGMSAFSLWRWPAWQGWARVLRTAPYGWMALSLAVFLVLSPYTVLEWRQSAQDFFYEYRHMQIGSAAHYAEGVVAVSTSSFRLYANQFVSEWGIPALLLVCLGIFPALRTVRWYGVALLVYAVLYAGLIGSWGNYAARYALLLDFPLAVFAAGGFQSCSNWMDGRLPRWKTPVLLFLLVFVLVFPLKSALDRRDTFLLPDARQLAYPWILENIPSGASIAFDSYAPDLLAETLPYTLLRIPTEVLGEYSTEMLHVRGVEYVITTTDPQNLAASPTITPENWQAFLRDYQLLQVFHVEPGQVRGRSIWIYQAR